MTSIFFDLETTDRSPIGQILNAHFIVVDQGWKQIDELSLDIRISPLQLPSPGAILVNRTAVLDHQAGPAVAEPEAMRTIAAFIAKTIHTSKSPVQLIGYNSGRFDVMQLRTSMIRNGVNPFFYGKLINRDLLHTVRFLSITDSSFPREPKPGSEGDERQRLSLKLETITRSFGLLTGEQSHHSQADTLLTLKLAQLLSERFATDVRRTSGYDAATLHSIGSSSSVVTALFPNYDLSSSARAQRTPYTFLCGDARSGLWVNLEQYSEGAGREAVRYLNNTSGFLHIERDPEIAQSFESAAKAARADFRDLRPDTFFEPSSCDIEADIYRLFNHDAIDALTRAIKYDDPSIVAPAHLHDAHQLFVRYQLACADWEHATEEQERLLHDYALYRYGGRCNISKSFRGELYPEIAHEAAHPTLREQLQEIDNLLESASGRDRELLSQLKEFHLSSAIMRVAGQELMALQRAMPIKVHDETTALASEHDRKRPRGGLVP